jgi:hypothetical protein
MQGLQSHVGILHTIKAWLYHNHFQHVEGKYVARTKAEYPLSVENVCASATTRGGSKIDYDIMVEAVQAYFTEAAYQLADGFSVANTYFAIHPRIGGTFESAQSPIDPTRNKIDLNFQKRKALRDLLAYIKVDIQGVAETDGYIDLIRDINTGSTDDTITSNGVISIEGYKVKITGDTGVGLFFTNVDTGAEDKFMGHFVVNAPSKLVLQLPDYAAGTYRIQIRTRYSGSSTDLKELRVIDYPNEVTVIV